MLKNTVNRFLIEYVFLLIILFIDKTYHYIKNKILT